MIKGKGNQMTLSRSEFISVVVNHALKHPEWLGQAITELQATQENMYRQALRDANDTAAGFGYLWSLLSEKRQKELLPMLSKFLVVLAKTYEGSELGRKVTTFLAQQLSQQ